MKWSDSDTKKAAPAGGTEKVFDKRAGGGYIESTKGAAENGQPLSSLK